MKTTSFHARDWGFAGESGITCSGEFVLAFEAFAEGQFDIAEGMLSRLIEAATESTGGQNQVWMIRQLRIANFLAAGMVARAESESEVMLRETDLLGESYPYGVAMSSACAVAALQGHSKYAIELGLRAKSLLASTGSPVDLSRALTNLGYARLMCGDLERAQRELDAAASLAEAAKSPFLYARACQQLGLVLEKQGRFSSAHEQFEAALVGYAEAGAERHRLYVLFAIASMALLLGEPSRARLYMQTLDVELRSQPKSGSLRRLCLLNAWALASDGKHADAIGELTSLLREFADVGSQREMALCQEFLGDSLAATGRFEEAVAQYHAGLDNARRVSPHSDVALECLWKLGEVHCAMGRLREALSSARHALRIARVSGNRFERAAVYRLRGKIQIARGRARLADALLQHAWHEYSSMGAEADARKTAELLEALRRGEDTRGTESPSSRPPRITIGPHRSTVRALEAEIRAAGIISEDARVLDAYQQAIRAADTRLPVLILGETGTGKELFATLIHQRSSTSKSFVPVNCAALPPDLLDAELFGHSRGAFTGALRDRPGLIEEANEGTLFLDEVGEMTLPVQGRLLRALEQGEIRRLGETKPRFVTTRYVAATHRNLEEMVRQGSFRTDLFFRLKGVVLQIPPLRERKRDIELLIDHFLNECGKRLRRRIRFSPQARAQLLDHPWPGNVRELKSLIDRLVAMSDDDAEIDSHLLGLGALRTGASLAEHLEEEERSRVVGVLQSVRWNQSAASRILKLKRTTLIGRMKRLGIEPPKK